MYSKISSYNYNFQGNSFFQTNKLKELVSNSDSKWFYYREIATIENPKLRDYLFNTFIKIGDRTDNRTNMFKTYCYDIIEKLNLCEDAKAMKKAEEYLTSENADITKADVILDAANIAMGKYCPIYSKFAKFATYTPNDINIYKTKLEQLKNNGDSDEDVQRLIDIPLSEPFKIHRLANRRGVTLSNKEIEYITKYENLKFYILQNPDETEIADYLWEKYFLNSVSPKIQKVLKSIRDEFGTRICCKDDIKPVNLCYIREEMKMWRKACGENARFADVLDVNESYLTKLGDTSAFTGHDQEYPGYMIEIPERNIMKHNKANSLRHEFAHVNDSKMDTDNDLEIPFLERAKIRRELFNAGIDEKDIEYAFTNITEKKAVSMEANMESLSKEYIEELKKEGLPEGIENLRDVSLFKCELMEHYFDPEYWQELDKLDNLLNGIFSEELLHTLYSHFDIQSINEICNKYKSLTSKEFLELYSSC